jgi:hypothetical protein
LFNRHQKIKAIRKYDQDKKEFEIENPDQKLNEKIKKFQQVEELINSYDKNFIKDEQPQIEMKPREKKARTIQEIPLNNVPKQKPNDDKYLNKKRRTKEDWEKEKEEKLQKRKNIYKKLNKKTPKGQPVMKFQVQHLLHKIKDKISKGII